MTTLLVSEYFPPRVGGSARWLWELYRRLPRQEYVLAVGQHPSQAAFDATHDARIVRMQLSPREVGVGSRRAVVDYWTMFRRLRRLVAAGDIDQIHAGRCLPEGWLALLLGARFRVPYLCYVHGEEVNLSSNGGTGGTMASRQLRWMTRLVLGQARRLIANSQHTWRILEDQWRLPSGRIRLVHPGVDTARFVPAPRDLATRARLGWGERPIVLTVGRLQRRKGHDQMIAALEHVRARIPDVLYAIVGTGEEEPYLRELVSKRGLADHVQFVGATYDDVLVSCYQQCDLFVLPNRQEGRDLEGFGMVLLEAQACGKPVIAGASGGTADTLRVPDTGRLVPCDRPEPVAEAVADLLTDRDRLTRMGQAARAWVVERFDWAAVRQRAQAAFLPSARPP